MPEPPPLPGDTAPPESHEAIEPAPLPPVRPRRRRWWSITWKVLVVLLLLLIGAVYYIQTPHALRHVIMPYVRRAVGTPIDYSTGALSLGGVLEMENVSLQGSDGAPAFSAAKVHVRVDPRLLLAGNLVLRDVNVAGAQLKYAIDVRGKTNWDFLAPASSAPKTGSRPGDPLPEVHIDQLAVSGMQLFYEDGKGLSYFIDPLDVKASNLARGQDGKFDVTLKGGGRQAVAGVSQTIELKFDGNLKQGAAGELLGWNGKLASTVGQARPGTNGTTETQQITVAGQTEGEYATSGKTLAKASMNAATSAGSVGDIAANVQWDPAAGNRLVDFTLTNIGPDALNPLLVAAGPIQLETARVQGKGQVRGVGDAVNFSLDLGGSNLSFRRGKERATAPLAVNAQQTGAYDLKTKHLKLDTLSAGLMQADRKLIDLKLNQPAELDLVNSSITNAGAQITLEVHDVAWDELKPWLVLAGVTGDQAVTAGRFSGKSTLDLGHNNTLLALDGALTADGLQLKGLDAPPLRLTPHIKGSLATLKALNIEQGALELATADGEALASIQISGDYFITDDALKLKLGIDAPRLVHAIDVLNGAAPPPANISGGHLQADQLVSFNGKSQELILSEGKLKLDGLTLKMNSGETPLSAEGALQLRVDFVKQLLKIEQSDLKVTGAGAAQPGNVQITGNWPLGGTSATPGAPVDPNAAPRVGALKLSVEKVDAAPWLALLGVLHAEPLPQLPLEAHEEITMQGDTLSVKGDAQIGLPAGASPNASAPQQLEIQHALQQAGSKITNFVLDADAPHDAAKTFQKVHLEGSGETAPTTQFKLTGKAETLDVDALMARIAAVLGTGPAAPPPLPAEKKTERPASLFEADLEIGKLLWNQQELKDAKARARFEQGVWTVNVDQAMLNGGPFHGQYSYDGYKTDPTMAWDVQAEHTPVEKLVAIGSPGAAKKVSGIGTIHARGSLAGTGEKLKKSLQGVTDIKIENGSMGENRFLQALAEQTLIPGFKKIDGFNFGGGVNMADGRATFEKCLLVSNLERVDIRGWTAFDGSYEVTLIPAIGKDVMSKTSSIPLLGSLMETASGFYQFPFGVTVKGTPDGKWIVIPHVQLPIDLGNGIVGKTAGVVTGGVNTGVGLVEQGVKSTVGGVFRTAGKGLDLVTGKSKTEPTPPAGANATQPVNPQKPDPATGVPPEDEPSTKTQGFIGKTTDKVSGAAGAAAGAVKSGATGLFKGVKKLL